VTILIPRELLHSCTLPNSQRAQIRLQREDEASLPESVCSRLVARQFVDESDNRQLTKEEDIERAIKLGEFIKRGPFIRQRTEVAY
jgi:hypothetical protein